MAVVLALVALFTVVLSEPASAADQESISGYDTKFDVHADGSMQVTETIAYNFGANKKHGIFRNIPTTFHYDDERDRVYPIDDVQVTRNGAKEKFDTSSSGGDEVIKVGDKDTEVSGAQTYVLTYTVRGVINAFSDHEELYWNAIGKEWTVPIASSTAEVTGPAEVQRVTCYRGFEGSTDGCEQATKDGDSSHFSQADIGDGKMLTVVVAFPVGSISNPGPILKRRHVLANGFRPTPVNLGGGILLAVLGSALALFAAYRVGRDRRCVGTLPGLTPGYGERAVEERKPLGDQPPVVVEFGVPDGIRPGQVGTLQDERADVIDVTATIVDFAVRGHLHIKELDGGDDWELVKLTPAPQHFLQYERLLFAALFNNRDTVTVDTLRQKFASDLTKVREQLYTEMVTQGWYKRSPRRTRALARWAAGAGVVVAGLGTYLLAGLTPFGFIGLGLLVAALVLLAVAGTFPARTGRGSAALSRLRGLRLYISQAEAAQIRFHERMRIFSELMPYAIVFGLAEHWAGVFQRIGAFNGTTGGPQPYWYSGPYGWSFVGFHHSIDTFNNHVNTAISAAPPSASGSSGFGGGGFSGGGGGGGGGGSW
jgi:uncharacterized protein (TIGR04222 family)